MSAENKPLISGAEISKDNHGSTNSTKIRESSDCVISAIGDGHMSDNSHNNKTSTKKHGCEKNNNVYNPWLDRILEHPTSNSDTLIHLLKGNIGTGILAMPDAFRNAGWFVGIVGTMFMAIICTHCMHILLYCSKELCERARVPTLGFANVAEVAIATGPLKLRPYSRLARIMVNMFLVITQIGFCCVYFLFVATNLQEVFGHYLFELNVKWFLVMMLLPLIALNFIKSLKYMTPASLIASLLTLFGLAITFFYLLQGLPKIASVQAFAPLATLPLYFGTAVYAFEGISLVLPLENNMASPQDLGGNMGVLNTGMIIVASLYISVGFFGYLKYGDAVQLGSITLNLPLDEVLAQTVRLCMAFAIYLSYSLQFYVPMNIIWPKISQWLETDKSKKFGECVTRITLVLFTFFLAAAIPNLSAVISLVGSISSSMLALILPAIIELVTYWDNGISRFTIAKDVFIATFGFFGFIVGSYSSIENIISDPDII